MRFKLFILTLLILSTSLINTAQAEIDCDTVLEIWQIQGSGQEANCLGERIDTEGNIVTAVGHVGFFMQTPAERSDNDPTTSDGIYAFLNTPPSAWGIQVGDIVNVNGRVKEEYDLTRLEVTGQRRVTIISSGNAVPNPVDLTTVNLDYTPGDVHPLERYEGMLVTIQDGAVMAPTNRFDEFVISLTGQRAFREPGIEADTTPEFAGIGLPEWDLNPELIEVDPPEMGLPAEQVNAGSTATVTGGLAYAYLDYQIWPSAMDIEPVEFAIRPVRARTDGEFTIATQNVENFFDTVDDPGKDDSTFENYVPDDDIAYQVRLRKLSEQIRVVLGAPNIVALQEIENNRALSDLIFQIYSDDPSVRYTGCLLEGWEGRGIDVAYLIQTEHINILDCYRLPGSYTARQPGTNAPLFTRPPLVLDVEYLTGDGEAFPLKLINLHNKSLSGIETEDTQERRMYQAMMVAEYVQTLQQQNPDVHVAVLGDINAFQFSDGLVDVVGIITGTHDPAEAVMAPESDIVEPDLINQITRLPADEQYSYMFNGSFQILDHILTTQALDGYVTDAQYGRSNADALTIYAEEDNGAIRSSDHDGLVVYIQPVTE